VRCPVLQFYYEFRLYFIVIFIGYYSSLIHNSQYSVLCDHKANQPSFYHYFSIFIQNPFFVLHPPSIKLSQYSFLLTLPAICYFLEEVGSELQQF